MQVVGSGGKAVVSGQFSSFAPQQAAAPATSASAPATQAAPAPAPAGSYLDTLVCESPTQMPQAQVTQANFYQDIDAKLTFVDEMAEASGSFWTATECPH